MLCGAVDAPGRLGVRENAGLLTRMHAMKTEARGTADAPAPIKLRQPRRQRVFEEMKQDLGKVDAPVPFGLRQPWYQRDRTGLLMLLIQDRHNV